MKTTYKGREFILMIFIFAFSSIFYGQNQKLSDSLIILYKSGTFQGGELDILKTITETETDPIRHLKYSDILIKKAAIDSSFSFLQSGFLQRGNALTRMGKNGAALEAYFESLD